MLHCGLLFQRIMNSACKTEDVLATECFIRDGAHLHTGPRQRLGAL